jgi:hypothetical protein
MGLGAIVAVEVDNAVGDANAGGTEVRKAVGEAEFISGVNELDGTTVGADVGLGKYARGVRVACELLQAVINISNETNRNTCGNNFHFM